MLEKVKGTPELSRQEVIHEIIMTEKEFCLDLENLIQVFILNKYVIDPLLELDIIDKNVSKRQMWVQNVFSVIRDILKINTRLLRNLEWRQSEDYVVSKIR